MSETPQPGSPEAPAGGERPPAGRLARPPSERYATGRGGGSAKGSAQGAAAGQRPAPGPVLRRLGPAIAAGLVTAVLLTLVSGVLAERFGLFAIAAIGGVAIGLLAARAAVEGSNGEPPLLTRPQVGRAAVLIALGSVVTSALLTWAYGRLEGGVMEPVSYLWTTFGPLHAVLALFVAVPALWGAGAGPIRSGS